MPKTLESGSRAPFKLKDKIKRPRLGRPPLQPPEAAQSGTSTTAATASAHPLQDEARKKITNCTSLSSPSVRGGHRRARVRGGPRGRPLKHPRAAQPHTEPESESEDDIPASFSEVVKIIIQKVHETQVRVKLMDKSISPIVVVRGTVRTFISSDRNNFLCKSPFSSYGLALPLAASLNFLKFS